VKDRVVEREERKRERKIGWLRGKKERGRGGDEER
jgi:hypothetical protein